MVHCATYNLSMTIVQKMHCSIALPADGITFLLGYVALFALLLLRCLGSGRPIIYRSHMDIVRIARLDVVLCACYVVPSGRLYMF